MGRIRTFFLLAGAAVSLLLFLAGCTREHQPPHVPGAPISELRVCSENLDRFGEVRKEIFPARKKKAPEQPARRNPNPREQLQYLVQRMYEANCDVIALQEVAGGTKVRAHDLAAHIAEALSRRTQRSYSVYVGESVDPSIRNGFLIAKDVASEIHYTDYHNVPLVRLMEFGPVATFLRAPVGATFSVRTEKDPEHPRKVFVMNIHFKSRAFGFKDPKHLDFETLRIEMAETARRVFLKESAKLGRDGISVLVGDRNNDVGSATSEVLSGARLVTDFRKDGGCSIELSLAPNCGVRPPRPKELVPLFELQREKAGEDIDGGSYRFHGREEILDEILLRPSLLPLVEESRTKLRIGIVGEYLKGSDHRLTWVSFSL